MMRCIQAIMGNILMWVTIYNQFANKLGSDNSWNWLNFRRIFIVPLPFFLYVESLLCKPTFSLFPYTDCIHILIPADSDRWKWSSTHDIV